MADAATKAMQNMGHAAEVVRAFSGSDTSGVICAMLDALIEIYKLDLMHVTPEGLIRLQAALRQTQSIRDVVAGESQDIPKI
jgi:hypothetical protein